MNRKKATIYVDEELLRNAKVWAARTGRKDYEIFEDALKAYLGFDLLERIWSRSDLSEEEAEKLAYDELRAARKEARGKAVVPGSR